MGLDLPNRPWTAESYANVRSVNQLNVPRDINILYFKTEVQKDAYFGHLDKKTVFKHQTIDLGYMRSQQIMSDLMDRFEQMGLANFLQYRCDWNETVICQFYTTLEINMVEFGGQLPRELIMLHLLSLPLQINWTMILLQMIKV